MIVRPKIHPIAILFTLKGSIAKRIALRALMITLLASAIVLVEILHPSYFASVSATPFTLLGLSLSIFMSFRNNACYDRWYEARKAWGEVIVHIRSIIRETHVIRDSAERKPLLLNLCGFAHALNARLRKESEADASSQWVMPKPDPQTPDYSGRILQTVGQSLLFRKLGHALCTDHRQLTLELGDPRFKHAVGVGKLARHLVEQGKRLLKAKPACLLYGRRLPRSVRDRRHLGGLGHRALSLG